VTNALKTISGWVTSLSFFVYCGFVLTRWSQLDIWYQLFAAAAFVGALLLLLRLLRPDYLPRWTTPVTILLLVSGAIGPIDACAFFVIMRVPFDGMDILQFVLPPSALFYHLSLLYISRKSRQTHQNPD